MQHCVGVSSNAIQRVWHGAHGLQLSVHVCKAWPRDLRAGRLGRASAWLCLSTPGPGASGQAPAALCQHSQLILTERFGTGMSRPQQQHVQQVVQDVSAHVAPQERGAAPVELLLHSWGCSHVWMATGLGWSTKLRGHTESTLSMWGWCVCGGGRCWQPWGWRAHSHTAGCQ
jgi:hypothetical protein